MGYLFIMFLQLIINTLIVGSGYALIAMSFRLMYSVSPFFNLTLGAVAAFSAYMALWLTPHIGYYAIVAAIVLAAVFSFCLEYFAYKPMRENGASPMILLVASLGIYTIFESSIHFAFGPQYRVLGNVSQINQVNLGFTEIPLVCLITIIAAFLIFVFLNLFLHHTFIGKVIRSIQDSSTLANIMGIRIDRIIAVVAIITGVILGIAGVLVGYDTGMEPTMGFNLLFKGMIGAIIGGMKNMRGAFLGALFLAFAENLGVWIFASEWRDLVAFVIFIVFLYLRPHGIFQKKPQLS